MPPIRVVGERRAERLREMPEAHQAVLFAICVRALHGDAVERQDGDRAVTHVAASGVRGDRNRCLPAGKRTVERGADERQAIRKDPRRGREQIGKCGLRGTPAVPAPRPESRKSIENIPTCLVSPRNAR